jgi:hypothetical protein
LLTKEAFDLYLQQLAPEGILAANISNRYLDLIPVFWQQARYYHLNMVVIPTQGDGKLASSSLWVLLARDPVLLQNPAIAARAQSMSSYSTAIPQWTDDFSNLFQILK